jgi:hypothetical protein
MQCTAAAHVPSVMMSCMCQASDHPAHYGEHRIPDILLSGVFFLPSGF